MFWAGQSNRKPSGWSYQVGREKWYMPSVADYLRAAANAEEALGIYTDVAGALGSEVSSGTLNKWKKILRLQWGWNV